MTGDLVGIGFFIILIAAILIGLKALGKQRVSTEEEFEERASESVSAASAGFQAINGILNPSADKGAKAVAEVKKGEYLKKKEEGKGLSKGNKGTK
ncbi:MAG: hypothetical protein HKN33_00280 [Pyrinomonadaceae bacterium]|nr:hypothetical protein [Pyrinomonadaceae bacterium]